MKDYYSDSDVSDLKAGGDVPPGVRIVENGGREVFLFQNVDMGMVEPAAKASWHGKQPDYDPPAAHGHGGLVLLMAFMMVTVLIALSLVVLLMAERGGF